jgi:hypothetical protein
MPNEKYIIATYLLQTEDKGYIICGSYYSQEPEYNPYRGFLWKVSKEGKTEWIRTYKEEIWVILDAEEGYICAGYEVFSEEESAAILCKVDFEGTIQWKKTYQHGDTFNYGLSLNKTNDR